VWYACETTRFNRVLTVVIGVLSSLFIQRKYDSELVGDSEVTEIKKKNIWLPVVGSGSLNSEQTGRSVTFISKMTYWY